jgi:hypothetical protein
VSSKRSNTTLSTLSEGALEELFQRALGLVLENIQDPNTPADGKGTTREINIKVSLTPSKDRSFTAIEAAVSTKLAGPAPVVTSLTLKDEKGIVFGNEVVQGRMGEAGVH